MPKKAIKKTKPRASAETLRRKRYEKFITKQVEDILEKMHFDFMNYRIAFNYKDSYVNNMHPKAQTIFTINCSSTYKQARITSYQDAYELWVNGESKALIDGLIHEMCHMHTSEIAELAQNRYVTSEQLYNSVETVTEVLAEYVRRYIRLSSDIYNIKK